MGQFFSIAEAAAQLGCSVRRLKTWMREHPVDAKGEPFCVSIGRAKSFDQRDIERLRMCLKGIAAEAVAPPKPPPKAARQKGSGLAFIYCVKAGEFIKIGRTREWRSRVHTIQVGSPHLIEVLHVELNNEAFEVELHTRFRSLRHRGEWFHAHPNLISWITERAADPLRSVIADDHLKRIEIREEAEAENPELAKVVRPKFGKSA